MKKKKPKGVGFNPVMLKKIHTILDKVEEFLKYAKEKKYLRINGNDLWSECKRQASQQYSVDKMTTRAKSAVHYAKLYVEDAESFAMTKGGNGGEGKRVADIKSAVSRDGDVKKAKRVQVDAERVYGFMSSLSGSMQQKKSLLRDMVKMLIYASVNEGTDFTTERKAGAAAFKQKYRKFTREVKDGEDETEEEVEEEYEDR